MLSHKRSNSFSKHEQGFNECFLIEKANLEEKDSTIKQRQIIITFLFQFSPFLLQIHRTYNSNNLKALEMIQYSLPQLSHDRIQTAHLTLPACFSILNSVCTPAGERKTIFRLSLRNKRLHISVQGVKSKRQHHLKDNFLTLLSTHALCLYPQVIFELKAQGFSGAGLPGNCKDFVLSKNPVHSCQRADATVRSCPEALSHSRWGRDGVASG